MEEEETKHILHSSFTSMRDVDPEQLGFCVTKQSNDLDASELVADHDNFNSCKNLEDIVPGTTSSNCSSNKMEPNEFNMEICHDNMPPERNDVNTYNVTDSSSCVVKSTIENVSNSQMEEINEEVKTAQAEELFHISNTNNVDLADSEKILNGISATNISCSLPVDDNDCSGVIPNNNQTDEEKTFAATTESNSTYSKSEANDDKNCTEIYLNNPAQDTNQCQISNEDVTVADNDQECLKPNSMGLNLLANYLSSSESEDECIENNKANENNLNKNSFSINTVNYRDQINLNDSDISDSSDSDIEMQSQVECSISDDESSDDLDEIESGGEQRETNRVKKTSRRVIKAEGELTLDDLPPIEDLHITVAEDECVEFGKVDNIVKQLVLVKALPKSVFLDIESILFLEKGKKVLGAVFDVLGPVSSPIYCVRFNSTEHIQENNIHIGDVVYAAPKTQYTQFIILSNLMKMRGSDASWVNDVEPPPECLDYSDDEAERSARQQMRNRKKRTECADDAQHPPSNGDLIPKNVQPKKSRPSKHQVFASTSSYNPHLRPPVRERQSGSMPDYHYWPQNNMSSWHSNFPPNPYWNQYSRQLPPPAYNYYPSNSPRLPRMNYAVMPPPRFPYFGGQHHPQFGENQFYNSPPPPLPPHTPHREQ